MRVGTYARSLVSDLGDAYCDAAAHAIGPMASGRPMRRGRAGPAADRAAGRWRSAGEAALGRRRRAQSPGARLAIGFAAVKVTRLPDVQRPPRGRSVAVGTFDGVHLGHRAVIEGSDSVLTFEPHPVAVVARNTRHGC